MSRPNGAGNLDTLVSNSETGIEHVIVPSEKDVNHVSTRLTGVVQWTCGGLLLVGVIGVLIARADEQRAALATSLLNLSAGLLIASAVATIGSAIAWLALRKTAARPWTVSLAMIASCSLIAVGGLGVGAQVLRLEAALRLQVGADFVFIGGAMPHDLLAQLKEAIHPSVPLRRVVLSNTGGSIRAALETAEWLQQRGVHQAVIEGDCASACAVLALLIRDRYLTPGAALGFHDLWGRHADSDDLRSDRAQVLARLGANDIDVGFIAPLMVGRELRYPDRAQLLSRGIVTGCWSSMAGAPEPCTEVSRTD